MGLMRGAGAARRDGYDLLWSQSETPTRRPSTVPAFWSIFGFLGCVAIILLSKWYGHLGIMTREDYYEDGPSAAPEERNHD